MIFSSLSFNSITLNYNVDGINPHFVCPKCKKPFLPQYKPVASVSSVYDFNQKVSFTCPACSATISLFVAVHIDATGQAMCIQRSDLEGAGGIPPNWWIRT